MNDAYRPRVEALKYFTDHPTCALKPIFDDCDFPINLEEESRKSLNLILELLDSGATKVEVLNDDPEPSSVADEIFITVPDPLPKALLVEMVELHPDEFDEIEPNVFRLWWD